MNDTIIMTRIFHKDNFDLKGHLRSQKVIFVFEYKLFFDVFSLRFYLIETKLSFDIFFTFYLKFSQNDNILKS